MSNHYNKKKKLSQEELEKLREVVLARKQAIEESKEKELLKKSKIFREKPGKILWWFCLVMVIFSGVFLVDGFLSTNFNKYEIKSSEEGTVDVIMRDGWFVPATYYWVYLNDQNNFAVHMYKGEYYKAEESGYIEIGQTPIFNIPLSFRVIGNDGISTIKNLEKRYGILRTLPIYLFIICGFWLFVNPSSNQQMILYGYFNLFVTPLLSLYLLYNVVLFLVNIGMYEMNLQELILLD